MAIRASEVQERGRRGGYADLEDRLLVLDFQAGNEDDAFAEIYRRYSGLARHVSQRILGNAQDAEEATQEAMLRVFQGLGRFNGRYAVQPWVARIATNVALDVVRARARRPQAAFRSLPDVDEEAERTHMSSPDPGLLVERRLDQERVATALAEIPTHHRTALVMREFEGRSHEEIADALGVTPPQAKALIHRAKKSFRAAWSELEQGRRRGLAALTPLFLAPLRLPEFVRRLAWTARHAAESGAAAPAATAAAATVGERATTAAVAILMVTTVSVGAVAIRDQIPRQASPSRERQPVEKVVPVSVPSIEPVIRPLPTREPRDRPDKKDPVVEEVVPSPVVEPSESPTPSPSVEPSPTPTETTPAPLPPVPDWSMKFSAIDKTTSLSLLTSEVSGTAGKHIVFYQVASGTLGVRNPISVHVEYWGSAVPVPDGTAVLRLSLDTASGRYAYEGMAPLLAVASPDDGTTTYTFSGPFTRTESPELDESTLGGKIPQNGTFELTLGYWQDRTSLVVVGLSLTPAPADGS